MSQLRDIIDKITFKKIGHQENYLDIGTMYYIFTQT